MDLYGKLQIHTDDSGIVGSPPAQVPFVCLVDLDCFYCQVEANRLSLPANVPIGVQQWDHLIAVNYVAKKKGVKRSMSVKAAKEIAPDLVPVRASLLDIFFFC